MKYTKEQIQAMRKIIDEYVKVTLDDDMLEDLVKNGFEKCENMKDEDIIIEFENHFGEDYFDSTKSFSN